MCQSLFLSFMFLKIFKLIQCISIMIYFDLKLLNIHVHIFLVLSSNVTSPKLHTCCFWQLLLYPNMPSGNKVKLLNPKSGSFVIRSNKRSWSYQSRFNCECNEFKVMSYSCWVIFPPNWHNHQIRLIQARKWVKDRFLIIFHL